MKPLQETSYQQHILRKIDVWETSDGFPKIQDFGIDRRDMEDYLSEKQDILDIPGSKTHQLTVYATIVLVPTFIASAFDHAGTVLGTNATLVGLGIGVLLSVSWWGITTWRVRSKLKAMRNDKIDAYLDAVDNF